MEMEGKKKLKTLTIIFTMVLLFSSIIPFVSSYETPSNNIIYVDDDGGADYTRIQDAIDNASDGYTVYVYNGIYYENITIDKSIKLIGENKGLTIIDGKNAENDGINLISIKSNEVLVNSFTIKNSNSSFHQLRFDNGVSLDHSYNITINNTRILECSRGIVLFYSSASIMNNTILRTKK